MHSGVVHNLDFEALGKRLGWLSLPFSVDRSPYFQVTVPVCTLRGGPGPSLLLMAGNHGDEHEGTLALTGLVRRLDPARLRGRITVLPLANMPAVMAASRNSPLDGGNLNRAFPGSPDGLPTGRLAHFLETGSFPRHDVVFDIHSGGTSMEHLPVALIERDADPVRQSRALALMRALGLPHGFVADNGDAAPTSLGAARRAGCVGLSGEFGGGGTVTADSMALTRRAIDNLLIALGLVEGPPLQAEPMRLMSLVRHSQGLYATRRGWFEPAVRLGDGVEAGELAGQYHDFERIETPEEPLHFTESGIVISRRLHTLCQAGDCLVQVAEPVER